MFFPAQRRAKFREGEAKILGNPPQPRRVSLRRRRGRRNRYLGREFSIDAISWLGNRLLDGLVFGNGFDARRLHIPRSCDCSAYRPPLLAAQSCGNHLEIVSVPLNRRLHLSSPPPTGRVGNSRSRLCCAIRPDRLARHALHQGYERAAVASARLFLICSASSCAPPVRRPPMTGAS